MHKPVRTSYRPVKRYAFNIPKPPDASELEEVLPEDDRLAGWFSTAGHPGSHEIDPTER